MVNYSMIRNAMTHIYSGADADVSNESAPASDSFLGKLRTKSGLAFDFPTNAQWEYAARAGHGSGYWGDGSPILNTDVDENLAKLCRYRGNRPTANNPGNIINAGASDAKYAPSVCGTAIVGSYKPNDWGIYDMHGNVMEWVLDSWQADLSSNSDGAMIPGSSHYRIGGSWDSYAGPGRPAFRIQNNNVWNTVGFRVACPVGIR